MVKTIFTLTPFPTTLKTGITQMPFELSISGHVVMDKNSLEVVFKVTGDVDSMQLPVADGIGVRRDGLWNHTCFEIFLAPAGREEYCEFNISPSGDWNGYRFDAYRSGMRPETGIVRVAIKVQSDLFRQHIISANISLASLLDQRIQHQYPWHIGVCAVIEDIHHNHYYFALTHCGPQPDFHLRNSFTLNLNAPTPCHNA